MGDFGGVLSFYLGFSINLCKIWFFCILIKFEIMFFLLVICWWVCFLFFLIVVVIWVFVVFCLCWCLSSRFVRVFFVFVDFLLFKFVVWIFVIIVLNLLIVFLFESVKIFFFRSVWLCDCVECIVLRFLSRSIVESSASRASYIRIIEDFIVILICMSFWVKLNVFFDF